MWDVEMYDPETDEPAKANTSDLNEELGQVDTTLLCLCIVGYRLIKSEC